MGHLLVVIWNAYVALKVFVWSLADDKPNTNDMIQKRIPHLPYFFNGVSCVEGISRELIIHLLLCLMALSFGAQSVSVGEYGLGVSSSCSQLLHIELMGFGCNSSVRVL